MSVSGELAKPHAESAAGPAVLFKEWEGRVVDGKFPLLKWLEGSGQSAVFLTERSANGSKKAAIRVIREESFAGKAEVEAQLSRWAAISKLEHPHLIRIFEFGQSTANGSRILYVVMEYAEENLSQILPQRALTPDEVKELLPPTVAALSFLHRTGFVHGQIRPSNVMAIENQIKISSDNLRKVGERVQQDGSAYDAPEVASSGFSPAADVWSVGALLVSVFAQREPGLDSRNSRAAIPDSIPEPFRGIVRGCLCIEPQQRSTLSDILSRLNAKEVPQETSAEQVDTVSGSTNWLKPVVVLAVLLVALLLGWRLLHRDRGGASEPPATVQTPAAQTPAVQTNPAPEHSAPPPIKAPKTAQAPERGKVLQQVLPDVSRGAKNTITGHVKVGVQVAVDAEGNVTQATLISAGPSRYFANQSLAAARRWKFSPPRVGEEPSSSEWILRFEFGRKSTQVFPSQVKP
jgi:TonB family protein